MQLILTMHAKERMIEYAITKEHIIEAIKRGSKYKQTDGLLASFGYLEVAYKIRGDKFIIKTIKIKK